MSKISVSQLFSGWSQPSKSVVDWTKPVERVGFDGQWRVYVQRVSLAGRQYIAFLEGPFTGMILRDDAEKQFRNIPVKHWEARLPYGGKLESPKLPEKEL